LLDPLPYVDFLGLQSRATVVITDSGGIQEETTYLGIPCLTVRENTERPITVSMGTNVLVCRDRDKLRSELSRALVGDPKKRTVPPLWDGHAGERIAEVLVGRLVNSGTGHRSGAGVQQYSVQPDAGRHHHFFGASVSSLLVVEALLIAAAIPLSVAKNGLRIFTIAELGTRVDPGFLGGKLHHDGGIIFFLYFGSCGGGAAMDPAAN